MKIIFVAAMFLVGVGIGEITSRYSEAVESRKVRTETALHRLYIKTEDALVRICVESGGRLDIYTWECKR